MGNWNVLTNTTGTDRYNLTCPSNFGFRWILAHAGLAVAQNHQDHPRRSRPPVPARHRDEPEQSTKTCLARPNRAADGRWPRHRGTEPPHRHEQDILWRWQDRLLADGLAGLPRDKTSRSVFHSSARRWRPASSPPRKPRAPGDCAIDCGADWGMLTETLGRPGGAEGVVSAIEAVFDRFAAPERHHQANGYTNVTIVPRVISKQSVDISFVLVKDDDG